MQRPRPPHDFDRKLCFDKLPKPKQPPNEPLRDAKREDFAPPTFAELRAAFEVMTTTGSTEFAATFEIEPSESTSETVVLASCEYSNGYDLQDPTSKRYGFQSLPLMVNEKMAVCLTRRNYTFPGLMKSIDPNWLDRDDFRSAFSLRCGDGFTSTMPTVLMSIIIEYAWSVPSNCILLYIAPPSRWNGTRKTILARYDDTLRDVHLALNENRFLYPSEAAYRQATESIDKRECCRLIDRATGHKMLYAVPLYSQCRTGSVFDALYRDSWT